MLENDVVVLFSAAFLFAAFNDTKVRRYRRVRITRFKAEMTNFKGWI
jgi:hypothetical protein